MSTVRAAGKVTIALRAGPPTADDHHPVAAVFQAVSLDDEIAVTPADEIAVTVRELHGEQTPVDGRNLAIRTEAPATPEWLLAALVAGDPLPLADAMGEGLSVTSLRWRRRSDRLP